ncbi:CsiV family protein [Pseudomonas sp. RP23018S]|uniref:CsiV family protein n=1 Tax=Pseudomonas sp. RP23018S TaxID=3096037 RepID=UPI002ACA365F|nr:CsiV family protein [Pseudomonas sp. RP23018S]MDZ5602358.1 CsiV family protein [Pseudomonas sp. RP23018S]
MRAIPSLALMLALFAPLASADGLYQVELLLIRQNAVSALYGAPAPEDWRAGAAPLAADAQRPASLDSLAERLQASGDYTVLLHKAWQQTLSAEPTAVALSAGEPTYGRSPIEGTVSLADGRFVAARARFWVNQLDSNGGVQRSEQLRQSNSNMKRGQLNFLDGGHLAVLIKVTPAGMRAQPEADPQLMEQ